MGNWKVFYAAWQMECCGTPFSVGDETSWPLMLMPGDNLLGGGWDEQISTLVAPVELMHDEGGTVRVAREDDGLVAALHGDAVAADGGWSGVLNVERHGGGWPETTGRVRAIQVVHQAMTPIAPGTHEPVSGRRSLKVAYRCPKWFGEGRSGVFVDLEVSTQPDPP